MNYTAALMGQDTGTANPFVGMGTEEVVKQMAEASKILEKLLIKASASPAFFTSEDAIEFDRLLGLLQAAESVLPEGVDVTKINAADGAVILRVANRAKALAGRLTQIASGLDAADIGAEIRQKIDAALKAADLDSIWVGPGEKRETIRVAYEHANPADPFHATYAHIIEKYNRDGTLKSGAAIDAATTEERRLFLAQRFVEAGVTPPAGLLPEGAVVPPPEAYVPPSEPKGIKAGTVLAVAAAGLAAYFALR